MKRLSIRTTLIALFSFVGLMAGLLAWISLASIHQLGAQIDYIALNKMPKGLAGKDIERGFESLTLANSTLLLAENRQDVDLAQAQITNRLRDMDRQFSAYLPLFVTAEGQALTSGLHAAYSDYRNAADGFRETAGELDEASRRSGYRDVLVHSDIVKKSLETLLTYNDQTTLTAYETAKSVAETAVHWAAVSLLICILVAAGAVVFSMIGIANPIRAITRAMESLSRGDVSIFVPFAQRGDELGLMAKAVRIFKDNAVEKLRLEQENAGQVNLTEQEREKNRVAELAKLSEMREATEALGDALRNLAAGDLTFRLPTPFAADFEQLRADYNRAAGQLSFILEEVTNCVEMLDARSEAISHGAHDLARRTEQQAVSLEETAAALDEVTGNVASSARRVSEVRLMVSEANKSARTSKIVAISAIEAMQRIQGSANQISNIIGVIDEIAFQTNLLALNAGVEASRAGDAGRGFTVVAQEVRNLAQRSALAAAEIKQLIHASTAEVESGVTLVRETDGALSLIESNVGAINEHMNAISQAADEQSSGLRDINRAINQLDAVTQENASMVESAGVSSNHLTEEATRLKDLLARFVLSAPNNLRKAA